MTDVSGIIITAAPAKLTKKHLDLTFQLGTGSFGESGFNTLTIKGLRASVSISKAGGNFLSEMNLRVWGMTQAVMNQLSGTGQDIVSQRRNVITISAYADDQTPAIVFQGIINQCWPDYSGAPDVALAVSALSVIFQALAPAPPSSFPTGVNVATFLGNIATQIGYTFTNNGVNVMLPPSYFTGSLPAQAFACAQAANIRMIFDDGQLAIWPPGGVRLMASDAQIIISRETGMISYPAWAQGGIILRSEFNPAVKFGYTITVQSDITPAEGDWSIFNLNMALESEMPGGKWEMDIQANKLGQPS